MSFKERKNRALKEIMKPGSHGVLSSTESCFFQQLKESSLHPKILKQARRSGQLNLSNRGMAEVPDVVWNINQLTSEEVKALSSYSMDSCDEDHWWEYVDLTKLILASNVLTYISPVISNYRALTVLDLHDNCLSTLPDTIAELQSLSKLNLSRNQFEELPSCIFQLKMLRILLMQHNQIISLSDDIGNLCCVEEMLTCSLHSKVDFKHNCQKAWTFLGVWYQEKDISHNSLKTLPHGVGFLSRAIVFNASNNQLISLPSEIGDMSALKRLEISHNKIQKLPSQIGCLHHLEQLYIQHNKITTIPPLPHCLLLKEIHCGFNNVTEISSEFLETLVSTRILDLRDNKLSEVPENIAWLQALERLDLSNNNLSSLPYTLGTLPHLKFLSIEGNPMRSIRRDIIQRGTVQLLRWLRSRIEDPSSLQQFSRPSSAEIDASNDFGVPHDIDKYSLRSTKTLTYSNKEATTIPKELIEMAAKADVNIVNFSKNNISEFPESMKYLYPKLSEFNISFNRLTSLPSFMEMCTYLVYLDLRNNQLQDLPVQISTMQQLREINLSYNKFHHLPLVLYELKKLEIILASDNAISDIDVPGLSNLAYLSSLDLHNNSIKNVPPELGTLTQLRSLLLEGNLFRNPRPAILAKGTTSLLEFLRGRMTTQ